MTYACPKGFTLTELLIVIAVFVIIASVSLPVYSNWHLGTQTEAIVAETVQVLRLARTRSEAGYHNSAHGVFFDSNGFTLYEGGSYASREEDYDMRTNFDDNLSLSTTFVGNEINFSQGLGIPDSAGTVTIGSETITVNDLGIVDTN